MNMIEERAEMIYQGNTIEEDAYKRGAEEQREIDHNKAKRAFIVACGWLKVFPWYQAVFDEFKKAMEE